jgi:hypothetical protein
VAVTGRLTWVQQRAHDLVQRVLAPSCYNCRRRDGGAVVGGEHCAGVREEGRQAFGGTAGGSTSRECISHASGLPPVLQRFLQLLALQRQSAAVGQRHAHALRRSVREGEKELDRRWCDANGQSKLVPGKGKWRGSEGHHRVISCQEWPSGA